MWFELRMEAPADEAELLAEFCFDVGAVSVSTQDADVDTPDEQPLYGEPGIEHPNIWPHNILVALFGPPSTVDQILEALRTTFPQLPRQRVTILEVEETDWVRHVQDQFHPICVTDSLWIVPSWCDLPSDPQACVLRLDPGLAFGTGSHPTTRLCLRWLSRHGMAHQSLLDYGCGSGILAIAAAKLGAKEIVGVDIDPLAVQSAYANAAMNGVEGAFWISEEAPVLQADVVVANILANPLKELAPLLSQSVAPSGWLVLSGILEEQAPVVAQAYRKASQGELELQVVESEEGWVCLVGQRPAR